MDKSPRILAGFVQGSLEAIDKIDAELGRRVREQLKPETLDFIESRSPVGWVPLEMDVELTECFYRVAGAQRARQALRANLRESCDKAVLKPMLVGALGIFGRSPAKILRWAPRVWGQLIRNGGKMDFIRADEGSVRLALRDLPPEISSSQIYLDGVCANISGFFDVIRVTGEVRLEGPDPATGCATFDISWINPGSPEPRS
jgi:hypothetical protein